MKTPHPARFAASLGTILLLLAPLPAAPATPPVPPPRTDAESKPYVLFMSTGVAVELGKDLYPVKDVSGRNFIVAVKGQPTAVPMTGEPHKLEFQHALMLTRTSASLTGLESGRAYTPGADPKMRRQHDAMMAEAVIGDKASLAEGQFIKGLNNNFMAVNSDARAPDGTPIRGAADSAAAVAAIAAADATTASQLQNQAEEMRQSNVTSGAFANLAAENDMAQELYDAVEVRFEVSSPVYLEKPYLVVITRFHTRHDKPGMARNAVYAKALESIGSKPGKIEVLQGGFPPGFELEEVQVHLYNDGKEVATDVAPKRVPLTRDEAFEYLKIEYLSSHKGATLTSAPALGRPDKEAQQRLTPNQWKTVYFVKVSKDGVPLGTYADEACSQPVDEVVGALAQNVRYYPALEQGSTVEGTARLSFRHLVL